MSPIRIVAIVLVIAGVLALAYGGFTYTKDTHTANLGPLSFSVAEKERVNVPMWAGLGAVIVGGVLLVMGGGRRG
jgi:TRAP-type C4-dicarboxylate transport system permease small subunit